MRRQISTPIITTIITTITALVLATLPAFSMAAGGSSYYGDEDLVILSEAAATKMAKKAVEELLKNSKKKLTAALTSPESYKEEVRTKPTPITIEAERFGYPATKITSLVSENPRGTTNVTISANGDIGKYDSFVLYNPARLVVDIWDIGSELSNRTISIDIDSEHIDKVRVGAHPGKVRLVFDSRFTDIAEHTFSSSKGALVVTFSNSDYEYQAQETKKPEKKKPRHKPEKLSSAAILNAISVCAKDAPNMTKKFTDKTGYRLKRVSLKVRNPDNKPDHYERRILKNFEAMKKKGSLKATTVHRRVVDEDGGRYLRYMKPLVIKRPCLNCHGNKNQIPVEVQKFISKAYPQDKATGYRLGQVRGAVSVQIPVQ